MRVSRNISKWIRAGLAWIQRWIGFPKWKEIESTFMPVRSRMPSEGENRIDTFRSEGETQRTMTEVQASTHLAGATKL